MLPWQQNFGDITLTYGDEMLSIVIFFKIIFAVLAVMT